jgi:hypothetical protein
VNDHPVSNKLDEVGYSSMLVFGNLGTLLIFQVLGWLFISVNFMILKYLKVYMHRKLRNFLEQR